MDFLKLAKERFATRQYDSRPIKEEKLNQLLDAARIAPTAANNQPQRIYVLRSAEALAKIARLTPCSFHAPVVIMVGYDEKEDWKNPQQPGIHSGEEDASIVATHMMLAAQDLGLGTCWVNMFPNAETEKAFGLPESVRLVLLMPVGYPSDKARPSPKHAKRKEISEFTEFL